MVEQQPEVCAMPTELERAEQAEAEQPDTPNTHYAVTIDGSYNVTLVACGPMEFCQVELEEWLEKHPLGEFDSAEILARNWRENEEECFRLITRQGQLLTGVVNALKGEPAELTTWSHHDAPELAAAMRERAEGAEAELERLRGEMRRLIEHRNPVAPAAIEEALDPKIPCECPAGGGRCGDCHPVRHNHMTRDIKPRGQCPACDQTRA